MQIEPEDRRGYSLKTVDLSDAEIWEADRRARIEPRRLTELFHRAVPVLRYLDWQVTKSARGFAEAVLPLNVESTNQHIAHQAAVILIAADYTGGIALSTLLHGVPIVGIHPQPTDYGAYLWGAKADIKWIKPSIADLVCTARIDPSQHEKISRRFFQGRRVLETVRIEMTNEGTLVAEANITYWVQDTQALRRHAFDEDKIHVLYDHRQKTSARLIAGLRALESRKAPTERLFQDLAAERWAGTHGLILATRFSLVAPQLQPMVAARTKHLDDLVRSRVGSTSYQIVNVGVGLDTRLLRIGFGKASKIFELDLPTMLKRRADMLRSESCTDDRIVPVPIDLRTHELAETLLRHPAFNPQEPVFVIWEGGSMYFSQAEVQAILNAFARIMKHADSVLWLDYVHPAIIDGSSTLEVVHHFMEAMQCLGEPFINGFEEIGSCLSEANLEPISDVASSANRSEKDAVYDLYRFCIARPRTSR